MLNGSLFERSLRALFCALTACFITIAVSGACGSAAAQTSRRKAKTASRKKVTASCTPCEAASRRGKTRRGAKVAQVPCHPPGYVDPKVKKQLAAAERDMKRAGIKPKITSAWRSSKDQNWIYNCTSSRRCRATHPGLYKALPPGNSLHEAGFAVDVSGVASGPRGEKHLTSKGRKIVKIMDKHGFRWRYGLRDPVHFEADPRKHGYRSVKQAITVNQNRCEARLAAQKASRSRTKHAATSQRGRKNEHLAQSSRRGPVRRRTA